MTSHLAVVCGFTDQHSLVQVSVQGGWSEKFILGTDSQAFYNNTP